MPLEGSTKTVALADLLSDLASAEATGEILVVASSGGGRLSLRSGRLVAAQVGRARTFVDAIFELLLVDGFVGFDRASDLGRPGDPTEIQTVLDEAMARLVEWSDIVQAVPSLDSVIALRPASADVVALRPDQWRIVVALGRASSVRALIDQLDVPDFALRRALRELVAAGLVVVTEPPERFNRPKIAAPLAAQSWGPGQLRALRTQPLPAVPAACPLEEAS